MMTGPTTTEVQIMEGHSTIGQRHDARDLDLAGSPLVSFARERLKECGTDGHRLRISDVWCYVEYRPEHEPPLQGWKLHVSGTAPTAMTILRRVFDLLVDARCAFKFANSMGVVKLLNSGQYARGGAGKFMTIYPVDDDQFRSLAAKLHEATIGLAGQTILSDRVYAPGSLVFYRYGAFSGRARRGNDSDMRYYIVAPDGTEVEDRRDAWFNPPPWATPPLPDAAPTATSSNPVLLDGRYMAREAIRHANKGGVFLAVDTETGAKVVVKQARRHVGMTSDGWEIGDGIRNEASMLDLFASTGVCPRRIALFEQQGDLFLVEEHVEGKPLREYASEGFADSDRPGAGPSWTRLAQFGRRLVDIVDTVHGKGVVLRDLSPNNVIVRPDDELVLIDLEFAVPAGTVTFPVGTPGYRDPGRGTEVAAADFNEDLYSLGALLHLLVTGTDPVFAMDDPPGRTVQERIAEYLAAEDEQNEAARLIMPLVLGLVDIDPARRWSLTTARAFLAAPTEGGGRVPGLTSLPDRDRLIDDGLGWLAHSIAPGSDERLWPTNCSGHESDPCNVQHGAAGVAAVLLLALKLGRGTGLAMPLRQACDWLVHRTQPGAQLLPGLYFGRAGVAWLLYDAGRWLDDPALVAHGLELAELLPLVWPNPDVTHGSAGAGLTQLRLWLSTGELRFADRLRTCVEGIVSQARRHDGRVLWPIPPDFDSALAGRAFYGFAHGSAGIGWLLLAAGTAAGRSDWCALAAEVGETLCRLAVRRHGCAFWPSGPDVDQAGAGETWCNGSSGVGTFLIRLWLASGHGRFLELAEEAARAVWSTRRHGSPANCHGLAGNGNFLLDMLAATGDARYRRYAEDLAESIGRQYVRRERWCLIPDDTRMDVAADYGVGLAGVLAFLLRLGHGTEPMWMAEPARRAGNEDRLGTTSGSTTG
jgi:hypothetical protein